MECPKCKAPLEQNNVGWSMDEENDYIEVDVECAQCDEEFFSRIYQKDLVFLDA